MIVEGASVGSPGGEQHLRAQVVWPREPSRQESSTETRMHTLGSAFLVKPAQIARSTSV